METTSASKTKSLAYYTISKITSGMSLKDGISQSEHPHSNSFTVPDWAQDTAEGAKLECGWRLGKIWETYKDGDAIAEQTIKDFGLYTDPSEDDIRWYLKEDREYTDDAIDSILLTYNAAKYARWYNVPEEYDIYYFEYNGFTYVTVMVQAKYTVNTDADGVEHYKLISWDVLDLEEVEREDYE